MSAGFWIRRRAKSVPCASVDIQPHALESRVEELALARAWHHLSAVHDHHVHAGLDSAVGCYGLGLDMGDSRRDTGRNALGIDLRTTSRDSLHVELFGRRRIGASPDSDERGIRGSGSATSQWLRKEPALLIINIMLEA